MDNLQEKYWLIEINFHGWMSTQIIQRRVVMSVTEGRYGKKIHGMNIINAEETEALSKGRFDALNASDQMDVVGEFPLSQKDFS